MKYKTQHITLFALSLILVVMAVFLCAFYPTATTIGSVLICIMCAVVTWHGTL